MNDIDVMILELGANGYSCAQMVVVGGLRLMGRDNPDLVRAMAGLAQGGGCSGELCGALSGGLCLMAMHTAKGMDGEDALPTADLLMDTLVEWFRAELCNGGGITCDAIAGGQAGCRGGMRASLCGPLVAKTWEKTVALLLENGIDPTLGRESG